MEKVQPRTRRQTYRIMLVDDHTTTRFGLKHLLEGESAFEVVGEASSVTEALQKMDKIKPDLMIIDLALQDGSGLELIGQVRSHNPDVKMLVLSMHEESLFADRTLQAGAMGYLIKSEAIDCIVTAIHQVLKNKIYLSENMANRILARRLHVNHGEEGSFIDALSNRELEVFELIGRGQTRSQLAKNLHLSIKTIETHQENIKKKLNLRTNQELVCRAVQWVLEKS